MKTNSINPLEGKQFKSLNQITEHPNTQRRPLQQTSASMPNKQKPTIKTPETFFNLFYFSDIFWLFNSDILGNHLVRSLDIDLWNYLGL